MATANTDAFPVNDTEYSVVDSAVNTLFKKFDYKKQEAQNDEQLKAHGVVLTEVQKQASTVYIGYRVIPYTSRIHPAKPRWEVRHHEYYPIW